MCASSISHLAQKRSTRCGVVADARRYSLQAQPSGHPYHLFPDLPWQPRRLSIIISERGARAIVKDALDLQARFSYRRFAKNR
jgi:hypothetical protein